MSLIHNMLKDLENRTTRAHRVVPSTFAQIRKNYSWHKNSYIVLLSILFIVLVTSLSWYRHKKISYTMASMLPLAPIEHTTTPAAEAVWTKPVNITGVTMQVKDNITELTFLLDHAALYRIISNDMQNQFSIIIDHATLHSALPPVNYLHTAIHNITTQSLHDDAKFTVTFTPGASIKYVNLTETDKQPELTIAIALTQDTAKSNVASTNHAIKAPALQNLLVQQYQSALQVAEAGQYQEAIQQLTTLLKADPQYQDARISLAALLLDQGKLSQAELIVDQGLQTQSTNASLTELKARILATQGNPKQALQVLQRNLPALVENPEYHALLAAMYEQTNEYQLAADRYKQLLAINPHNGSWWFGLGVSLDKLGQNKFAVEAYNKAMSEGQINSSSLVYLQDRLRQLQEVIDDKE